MSPVRLQHCNLSTHHSKAPLLRLVARAHINPTCGRSNISSDRATFSTRCIPHRRDHAVIIFGKSQYYSLWARLRPGSPIRKASIANYTQDAKDIETSDPDAQDTKDTEISDPGASVPNRIYIVGTGSIGKFVAHSLRRIPNPPPITLILHKPSKVKAFRDNNNAITITSDGIENTVKGFNVELSIPETKDTLDSFDDRRLQGVRQKRGRISSLIVTVKSHQTLSALSAVAHRLDSTSSILFLQNGLGVVEEVNERIFKDPLTRPSYITGILSHGVHANGEFAATHAGHGTMSLGLVPRISFKQAHIEQELEPEQRQDIWSHTSSYLLKTMLRTPVFVATSLSPTDMLQAQLEKLAVNCLINPLTALSDCRNGDLLENFSFTRVMRLLLAEICLVIQSLPELKGLPNLNTRFAPDRIESIAKSIAARTSSNISSTLQDLRRGQETEVRYINGYIVKRGEELGIKPVLNYMLMHTVMGKAAMISREVRNYQPMGAKSAKDAFI